MGQVDTNLTKRYWGQPGSSESGFLSLVQKSLFLLFQMLLLIPVLLCSATAARGCGQTPSTVASTAVSEEPDLPDAPSALPAPQQSSQANIPSRSMGMNQPLYSMDLGDKFKYIIEPNFGPRRLVMNSFGAGIRMANLPDQYPHEWRSGVGAYGRLYGDSFARTGAQSIARFSASVLLHEDPRYSRSKSTFVPARLGHAIAFTFLDKTDGGHTTIALSNFTGAAAGGFIGNAYLPAGFDDLTHAGQRSTVLFSGIAAQNIANEFAPEIGHLLMKVHVHIPHIPVPPVWWTGDK
jgi:hypothetical protein